MNKKFGRGKKRFTRNWKMKIGGDFFNRDPLDGYDKPFNELNKAVKDNEYNVCINDLNNENEKEKLFNCLEKYNAQNYQDIKDDILKLFKQGNIETFKNNPEYAEEMIKKMKKEKKIKPREEQKKKQEEEKKKREEEEWETYESSVNNMSSENLNKELKNVQTKFDPIIAQHNKEFDKGENVDLGSDEEENLKSDYYKLLDKKHLFLENLINEKNKENKD